MRANLSIGRRDRRSADAFKVVIATPEGLLRAPEDSRGVLSRRALIVVREFSWTAVRALLADIVQSCAAPTWQHSRQRLQRYFAWEHEDGVVED